LGNVKENSVSRQDAGNVKNKMFCMVMSSLKTYIWITCTCYGKPAAKYWPVWIVADQAELVWPVLSGHFIGSVLIVCFCVHVFLAT